jgi:hypothetical protein
MEPHGQNLLIEIDPLGLPSGRLWHRDLDGFYIANPENQLGFQRRLANGISKFNLSREGFKIIGFEHG